MRRFPGRGQPAGSRTARAAHNVRRLWPFVLMAWERWQALPPERKEQYRRQTREYAMRARSAYEERRRRRKA